MSGETNDARADQPLAKWKWVTRTQRTRGTAVTPSAASAGPSRDCMNAA
jgi:hypothetical protein